MQDSFANFMKKRVVRYIKEEIERGSSIGGVRRALLRGGHKHDLIEEAILALEKENFNLERALREPVKSQTLAEELYAEVLSSVIEYIQFQQKQGYGPEEIRDILLRYGHSKEILDNAISEIKRDSHREFRSGSIRLVSLIVLLFAIIFITGYYTGDGLDRIFIGFFPTIATLLVIGLMANRVTSKQGTFLWLSPFVFVAAFFIVGQSQSYDILLKMDTIKLAALNMALSLISATILLNPTREEQEPEPISDLVKEREKAEEMEKARMEKIKSEEKEDVGRVKEAVEENPKMRIKEIRPA